MSTLGPHDAASVFTATLPLFKGTEVKEDRGREVMITFLDISGAHLHSPRGLRESMWS